MFFKKKSDQNKRRYTPSWLPFWIATPLRIALKFSLIVLFIFFCFACYFWYQASKYDLLEVSNIPARNIVLDRYENEFATLHGENRRLITTEEIPHFLKQALYAREDAKFESHYGVQVTGLVRAAIRNAQAGRFKQGGSTLSMQLIKNTYDNRDRTLYRKFLEIALTLRLEAHYSKSEILTHYFNRIYFGAGCYGVEEASLTYFGKKTQDLNESEAALLVGIIRGPELYSPYKDPEGAISQRNQVLNRMVDGGFIDITKAEQIQSQPVHFLEKSTTRSGRSSYTLQLISRHLKEILSDDQIEQGGLNIHTTVDPLAIRSVDRLGEALNTKGTENIQTAAVVILPKSGEILAINGGSDIKEFQWNIALDARRPLLQAFTPFVYLAALTNGEAPLKDNPLSTGQLVGAEKVARFAQVLELNDSPVSDSSIFEGNLQSSPFKLATAYCSLANGGKLPHTFIIQTIENTHGEVLYSAPTKAETVALEAHTKAAIELMHGNTETWLYQVMDSSKRNAWSIQLSPELVIVVWSGDNHSKPMPLSEAKILSTHKALTEFLIQKIK